MVIIVSLHLLLAVGFMLYFFHVPGNIDIHSKNVTVAPANNGTQMKVEASVATNTNEKRENPAEVDKSEGTDKISPVVEDTGGAEDGKAQEENSDSDQVPEDKADSESKPVSKIEDSVGGK